MINEDVVVDNGYICTWKLDTNTNTKKYTKRASNITITALIENIDTGDIEVMMEYEINGDTKQLEARLGDISSKSKIMHLADKGVDVNDTNVLYVIKHLRNERENVTRSYVHSKLGFAEIDDSLVYKHYKLISNSDDNIRKSKYSGDISLKPKGNYEIWKKMISEEVIGRTPLELALSIGLSAPIAGLIGNELGMESPLIHIYGESTQGKTTAVMIATSAFGSPSIRDNGLIRTWNTTNNALHGAIEGNNGVPIAIDESSMSNTKDFTNLIYSLTSGKGKGRLNQDSTQKEQKTWNTTVISTGEHSLSDKSKQNTGLLVRLLEFPSVQWTESAKQAEKIKQIATSNYGHFGRVFVKKLLKLGKEKVIELYKEEKQILEDMMCDSEFTERMAGKLALITLAASITTKYTKIKLDVQKIREMIVENDKMSQPDREIDEKAYEILMQEVIKNRNKFWTKDNMNKNNTRPNTDYQAWGSIVKNDLILPVKSSKGTKNEIKNETHIVIMTTVFNEIMKDNGFENTKIILQNWKAKGMLDHEKDKLTRKRTIGISGAASCYVIKVKPGDMDLDNHFEDICELEDFDIAKSLPKNNKKKRAREGNKALVKRIEIEENLETEDGEEPVVEAQHQTKGNRKSKSKKHKAKDHEGEEKGKS